METVFGKIFNIQCKNVKIYMIAVLLTKRLAIINKFELN